MNDGQAELQQLQAWFLTAMLTPGGAARGVELARQQHGLGQEQVLRPAPDGSDRLSIYANGYVLRLLDCLQADYPVLRKTMGEELFDFFARAYIWRHPSRSPTLYDLGAGFAGFLHDSQAGSGAGAPALLRFPIDLARLERARSEAGRAPGLEKTARSTLCHAVGWLAGEMPMICLAPCTRLLALSFPLGAFWLQAQAVQADDMPAQPEAAASHVAISRLNYRLAMHDLQPWQFYFLQAAARPASAMLCAQQASRDSGEPVAAILAETMLWLPWALDAGLIHTVDVKKADQDQPFQVPCAERS
ncbi:putative DNA-binding domain-containing protein [Janthinobacterium sp. Mn2066]|uniref:HvfC/BufC family peptide modification chaperone n=1 Tax=Janthinobacterium sp. Mn2066 TaxID=3395264 RepID=UPI003BD1BD42